MASLDVEYRRGEHDGSARRMDRTRADMSGMVRQGGFTSCVQRGGGELRSADLGEHVLLVIRRAVTGLELAIDGRRQCLDLPPRSLIAVPRGTDLWVRGRLGDMESIHQLRFDDQLVRHAAGGAARFPLIVGGHDAGLASLAEIAAELAAEGEPPAIAWESCAVLILHRLLRIGGRSGCLTPRRGGLAGWQVRRTTDYIHSRLAEPIGLQELADIAGLSAFHFARAFKQSVGDPPHRYQTRRRIEKACELLADTDMSVVEIATAVGYEAPQTLTRLFRREMGATPSAWRREMRR